MMSHPVDEEKEVLPGRPIDFETAKLGELAPDLDAALSEDERARIVCSSFQAKSSI